MSVITLYVWRGVGLPDRIHQKNPEGKMPRGVWDCLTFPMDKRDNAERAYAGFVRQGFHVEMVKPHG